ncbi:hypothetical protein BBOV_III002580 [Babesia bovis T2Bo]|uniref:Uncharacterized protein n=1 Tax=Babesia bovis TaxID=5865 RepID=A7AMN9_BABBO|nr:hypothetical protein BBOV_III002580 [Babesia bovis T2Bo]EDO07823.1 hypothetical protein BBOV_III002580 [Babesia bovis T2Bo]|eukprot:XP_001611391.1 hypothetical protein [Babesia bovis T2Bo]
MKYGSLLDYPINYKEAIDWIVAVKQTGGIEPLAKAVVSLFSEVMKGDRVLDTIQKVRCRAQRVLQKARFAWHPTVCIVLREHERECEDLQHDDIHTNVMDLEYESNADVQCKPQTKEDEDVESGEHDETPESPTLDEPALLKTISDEELKKVIIESANQYEKLLKKLIKRKTYKMTYSPNATWTASCMCVPKRCAIILVSIAPMVFALTSMMRHVALMSPAGSKIASGSGKMGSFFRAAGYTLATDINPKKTVGVFRYNVEFANSDIVSKLREISGLSTDGDDN